MNKAIALGIVCVFVNSICLADFDARYRMPKTPLDCIHNREKKIEPPYTRIQKLLFVFGFIMFVVVPIVDFRINGVLEE